MKTQPIRQLDEIDLQCEREANALRSLRDTQENRISKQYRRIRQQDNYNTVMFDRLFKV